MVAIRRILCPTDFSEFAKGALEQAIVLGRRHEAEIVCACVIPTMMPPTAGLPFALPPHFDARARQAAFDELGRFSAPSRAAGLLTRLEVVEGNVASSIVELAESLPADLVVMGTHGASGFERLMLGSVTEKVLRRASCPVLTVPRRAHEAGHTPHAGFKSILCPVDFADASDAALRLAVSLARESSARLLLVHVLEDSADGGTRDLSHWTVPEYRLVLEKEGEGAAARGAPAPEPGGLRRRGSAGFGQALRRDPAPGREPGLRPRRHGLLRRGAGGGPLRLHGADVVRGAACPVVTVRSQGRALDYASGV